MTFPRHLLKRSYDKRLYTVKCANNLINGETITGTVTALCEPEGLTITSPGASQDGKDITLWIAGGTIPAGARWQDYTIRLRHTTTVSTTQVEQTFVLRVQDAP